MDVIDMITKDDNVSKTFKEALSVGKKNLLILSDKESKWSLIKVGDHYIDLNTANDRVIDFLQNNPIDATTVFDLVYEYIEKRTYTNDEFEAYISNEIDKRKLVFSKENGDILELVQVDEVFDLINEILESDYV